MSAFITTLNTLAKPQVDVITKAAKLAVEDGVSRAQDYVLAVLGRLEALLLMPQQVTGGGAAPQRPDPLKVQAAVAVLCIIDMFLNTRKLQTVGNAEVARTIADLFAALLPNALQLLRSGRSAAGGGGGGDTSADVLPSTAHQQQFGLFLKQIEPFVKQWAIGPALLAAMKAPLTAASVAAVAATGAAATSGADDGATTTAADGTTTTTAATSKASALIEQQQRNRISIAEARKRQHVIALITSLVGIIGGSGGEGGNHHGAADDDDDNHHHHDDGTSAPSSSSKKEHLPAHRREHHMSRLVELLALANGSTTSGSGSISIAKGNKGTSSSSLSSSTGLKGSSSSSSLASAAVQPSAAALFDSLTVLHKAVLQDLHVYADVEGSAQLLNNLMAVGGGGKRDREHDGGEGRGDGDDHGGDAAAHTAIATSNTSANNPLQVLEAARRAHINLITLESDVGRYLPLSLRLPSGAPPHAPIASLGNGYAPPHTLVDALRTFEVAMRDTKGRIAANATEVRSLVAAHGIDRSAATMPFPPTFKVPPMVPHHNSELLSSAYEADGGMMTMMGMDADAYALPIQQRNDMNGLEGAMAMLGAARAAPFSARGLLVFPQPEGSLVDLASVHLSAVGGGSGADGGARPGGIFTTSAVQPLSAVVARQQALLKAAAQQGHSSSTVANIPKVQRAWGPTCDEWLAARDMAHLPVLRFK